jgi:hypothetical protein
MGGAKVKSNYKLLVGVLVGAAGNNAIRGQQVTTPPIYLISEADALTGPTTVAAARQSSML